MRRYSTAYVPFDRTSPSTVPYVHHGTQRHIVFLRAAEDVRVWERNVTHHEGEVEQNGIATTAKVVEASNRIVEP